MHDVAIVDLGIVFRQEVIVPKALGQPFWLYSGCRDGSGSRILGGGSRKGRSV